MKVYSALTPWFVVAFLLINFSLPVDQNSLDNFYQRGQEQLEKGEWKKALNIWLKAKTGFEVEKEADPRIGFSFIDVVTKYSDQKYYEVADEMYFWGLKQVDIAKYYPVLRQELDRLIPLMDQDKAMHLQSLLDQKSPKFATELKGFWIMQDPYPTSSYNERLVEHWERIQYARNHYTKRSNTVYGTDDRGTIYIKYGHPLEIVNKTINPAQYADASGESVGIANKFKAEIWYYSNLKDGARVPFVFGEFDDESFGLQYNLSVSQISKTDNSHSNIPKYQTRTKSDFEHFGLDRQILRFLDTNFNTTYMVASEASNFQPLISYANRQNDADQSNEIFQLNTLYSYNQSWNLETNQSHLMPLNKNGHFGQAIYYIGEEVLPNRIFFASQYLDKSPDPSRVRLHDVLNTYIIASTGLQEMQFPRPLKLAENEALLSDILLANPQNKNEQLRIPFAPNLSRTFPRQEGMMVYFEVYNIPIEKDFQVQYTIEGIDENGNKNKVRDEILNYKSKSLLSPHWFKLPLKEFKGYTSYYLALTVKKNEISTQAQRSVTFKVVAN